MITEAAREAGHDVLTAQWGDTVPIGQLDWLVQACGCSADAEPMLWRSTQVLDHPGHLLAMADQPPSVRALVDPDADAGAPRVLLPDTHLGAELASLLPECRVALRPQYQMRSAAWRAILREIAVVPITVLTHRTDPAAFAVPSVRHMALTMLREAAETAEADGVRVRDVWLEGVVDSLAQQPALPSGEIGDWLAMVAPVTELARLHGIPTSLLDTMHILLSERASSSRA
ncbi:hypothetical protein [Saccharopolyspora griseoalba]|uniref:Uncharacterized protein n=1 Tax=Saccharopolyspora griseoalba TaxID=1431848 RepID=A0ABW2LTB9_9PSEU